VGHASQQQAEQPPEKSFALRQLRVAASSAQMILSMVALSKGHKMSDTSKHHHLIIYAPAPSELHKQTPSTA